MQTNAPATELPIEVLRAALDLVCSATGAEGGTIKLQDAETGEWDPVVASGSGRSFDARPASPWDTAERAEGVLLIDSAELREANVWIVPVPGGAGAAAGAIELYFGTPVRPETDDTGRLKAVARLIGYALENARLLETERTASQTLEQALERTSWLHVMSARLSGAAEERAVLELVAEHALMNLGARGIAVIEAQDGSEPTMLYQSGWPTVEPDSPLESAVVQSALATGEPSFVPSLAEHRRAGGDTVLSELTDGALAVLPFHARGPSVGALLVAFDQPTEFTAAERGFLAAVGELARQALERARLYESVSEVEERLSAVVETAGEAILVITESGGIESVNPAAERMFGYRRRELEAMDVLRILPFARAVGSTGSAAEAGSTDADAHQVEGLRADGTRFPVEIAVTETALPGRILYTVIVRDVTQQRQAQEALRAAKETSEEASRVKTRFLALVSHELRTPLNAILGFADLLLDGIEGDLTAGQRDQVRRMRRSGINLLQLIEELLFYTEAETEGIADQVAPVDFKAMLKEVVELVRAGAEQRGVLVSLRLPRQSTTVDTHPVMVRRVLVYLLSTAAKLANAGELRVTLSREPWAVVTRITGTGPSLGAGDLRDMWEPVGGLGPSAPLRPADLGLGLPISARLTRSLKGDLTLSGEPDGNFELGLSLPRREA